MPPPSSYAWAPEKEHGAYGYDQLLEIIMANDAEALDEYLEKYSPQNIEEGTDEDWRIVRDSDEPGPGYWGDRFWEAIRFGSVDVYHRLVVYQRAQAAAGSNLLSPPKSPHSDDVAADLAAIGNSGTTTLLAACDTRCDEIVDTLLDYGANVRDRTDWRYYDHFATGEERKDHETVLSLAIPYVGPALLRRLIDLGAPLHAPLSGFERRYEGVTILHTAATYANSAAVEILLDTPEGREMDLTRRAVETMKLLLPHYSPVNDVDSLRNTPLHLAVRSSYTRSEGSSTEPPAEGQDPSAFRHAISHALLENGARDPSREAAVLYGADGADRRSARTRCWRERNRRYAGEHAAAPRGAQYPAGPRGGAVPARAGRGVKVSRARTSTRTCRGRLKQCWALMLEAASSGGGGGGEERKPLRDPAQCCGHDAAQGLGRGAG
ncbi:ankyrin repeat-containing domain protein [Apiospora saccharicola]|uniref:Ankyrin repeat-containing domain protein n=1 Tax=Apiospora saccharicola TaxID=335842 RepID=A0ABR1UWJ9_9PEZI